VTFAVICQSWKLQTQNQPEALLDPGDRRIGYHSPSRCETLLADAPDVFTPDKAPNLKPTIRWVHLDVRRDVSLAGCQRDDHDDS